MALPDEPLTRSEQYLNRTATGSGTIPDEPLTRVEMYLNKIATGDGDVPEVPLTRMEQYLDYIAENGGGGSDITLETLNVSQNGTINAPSGSAYNKVVADVPNTYAASDEGKVVDDGALVSQTNETVTQNRVVNTTTIKQVTVNVPNTYAASDNGKVVSNGALVSQTAHAEVTANGTIDTTLNNSVVVNVPMKETLSWHQCPEAVRNYLANVDYTGVPYTQSSIETYAPNPAVSATNTKPIGKTIDGVTYYNTVPNADTPFATANKAGTLNPLDYLRWINSQTLNMRDLGGWACDGGTVRYGMLFRSGNLAENDEDLITNQLGIHTELDLSDDGIPAYGDRMRFIEGVGVYYNLTSTSAWRTNLRGIFDTIKYGEPMIFHCAMGADRTGTLACVLEGLLGMSRSDIDKDYELTSFYALRARNGNYQGGTADWAHLIGQIQALSGDTFRDKCVTFALSLGFTVSELNAFRHKMIDGNPEDIQLPTYTVTNNLENCSTSNAATSIEEGDSYAATITPDSGYTLSGAMVQITMGSTDITASAYSGGSISIANVSGNIVVQISAVVESQLKELFDPAAAVINQRFSSSGAYSALNGNFCTDFISVSGLASAEPWRIHIKDTTTATRFQAMAPNESVMYYKSDKTVIDRLMISTATSGTALTKHNDSGGGIYADINVLSNGSSPIPFDLSEVAYIRVCMAYSPSTAIPDTATLASVSIKADNITDGGGSEPVNLFDPNDSDVVLRGRFNSSHAAVVYADGQLCTGYIEAAVGDTFRLESDKAQNANGYTGVYQCYSSDGTYIGGRNYSDSSAGGWTWDADSLGGSFTVPSAFAGTAKVRLCVAYTGINNIKIYKQ